MESLVLSIGGCSGRSVDKEETLGLNTCAPGWLTAKERVGSRAAQSFLSAKAQRREALNSSLKSLKECVAHIVCRMDERIARDDHWIMMCHMEYAYVRASHWSGAGLVALHPSTPPVLTFLGSRKFAYMCAAPETGAHAGMPEACEEHVKAEDSGNLYAQGERATQGRNGIQGYEKVEECAKQECAKQDDADI